MWWGIIASLKILCLHSKNNLFNIYRNKYDFFIKNLLTYFVIINLKVLSVVSSIYSLQSPNISQQTNIDHRSLSFRHIRDQILYLYLFKLVPCGTNRPIKITDSPGQIEFGYRIKLTSARFTTGLCAITELKRDGSL